MGKVININKDYKQNPTRLTYTQKLILERQAEIYMEFYKSSKDTEILDCKEIYKKCSDCEKQTCDFFK